MGRILEDSKDAATSVQQPRLNPEMARLADLVAELREEEALALAKRSMAGGVPAAEILAACQQGMRTVGARHERGEYFMAGLIMAGEIMRLVVELLRPTLTRQKPDKILGRVVLGTIEGDVHDIGKNLFKDLMECHGFEVLDLGVDVASTEFIRAAADCSPQWVAVSVLMTESFPHLRTLVRMCHDAMPEQWRRPRILIGGGQMDERIFTLSGADCWAADVFEGLQLCLQQACAQQG